MDVIEVVREIGCIGILAYIILRILKDNIGPPTKGA